MRTEWIGIGVIGLLVSIGLVSVVVGVVDKRRTAPTDAPEVRLNRPTPTVTAPPVPTAEEKLGIEDITIGTGRVARAGDQISVQYTGTLLDGSKFDSSYDHGGRPFDFKLGAGMVIKGWDRGLQDMKVGGKRKLTIPPSLAYGANGHPPVIPPNATLVFVVELIAIKTPASDFE